MNNLRFMFFDFFSMFLGPNLSSFLASIFIVGVWIGIGLITIKLLNNLVDSTIKRKEDDRRTRTMLRLFRSLIKAVVGFIVFTSVLSELGIDITPILASAGVLGFAIGFGAQTLVKDFLSGFFIIIEESFLVGDVVSIGGFRGTVQKIGLRTTRLLSWTGQVNIINNGDINNVINFSKADSLAIVDFGVAYGTNLKKVSQIMENFMFDLESKYEKIVSTPSFLGVTDLADSSINLRIVAKTEKNEQFGIERGIRADIVDILKRNSIEIPFPQIVVHETK